MDSMGFSHWLIVLVEAVVVLLLLLLVIGCLAVVRPFLTAGGEIKGESRGR